MVHVKAQFWMPCLYAVLQKITHTEKFDFRLVNHHRQILHVISNEHCVMIFSIPVNRVSSISLQSSMKGNYSCDFSTQGPDVTNSGIGHTSTLHYSFFCESTSTIFHSAYKG